MMRSERTTGRRGISLIEVLVVLVILVIGILAMARLFPQGFQTLNFTADVTAANSLIRLNEDRIRERQENLPEAIVSINPATGLIDPDADVYRSVYFPNSVLAGYTGPLQEDPRFSGVNAMRRVIGERFRVPPPVPAPNGEQASLYRVNFSPIYSDTAIPGSSLGVFASSGTPFRRVVIGHEPQDAVEWEDLYQLSDPFSYAVDYSTGRLYFRGVKYERTFEIDFTYKVQTQPGPPPVYEVRQSVAYNRITIPADPTLAGGNAADPRFYVYDLYTAAAGFQPLPPGAQLDRDSERLYRVMVGPVPVGAAFDNDMGSPVEDDWFQFKVYDEVFGLVGVHPRLATVSQLIRQEGFVPTVRLDYDVDDWHILREDLVVPTNPTEGVYGVKLAMGAIKKIGDVEDTVNFLPGGGTTFEYQGLVRHYPQDSRPGTPGIDVMIVDMQDGFRMDNTTIQSDGGLVDYEAGVVRLPELATFYAPPLAGGGSVQRRVPGRHLRVYYRNYNDYAVASLKPPSSYRRKVTPLPLQTQEYLALGYGGFVLFPNTDVERTVLVDYLWKDVNTGQTRMEVGELHRVEPPGTQQAPGGFDSTCASLPPPNGWIRVARADQDTCNSFPDNRFDPDVVPGSVYVLGVRGASFHTHVMWREGKRGQTVNNPLISAPGAAAGAYDVETVQWRHLERATILTQAGAKR